MRLEVFKYFSQAPGDDQIILVVQWLLDEICVLLENFDFKKIDIYGENPMSINGALLQLEDYFFKPYYENEDYKVVLEMLKNAEIFSGGINTEKLEKLSEPKKKKLKYKREE